MQPTHNPNEEAISGDCRPQSTHFDISVSQLADTRFADSKVMRDFVHHRATNLLTQRGNCVMGSLQWASVENDAIRRNEIVVRASLCKGNALVQAKEVMGVAYSGPLQFTRAGPVCEGYRHIVHVLKDLCRQVSQRLLDQSFELRLAQD